MQSPFKETTNVLPVTLKLYKSGIGSQSQQVEAVEVTFKIYSNKFIFSKYLKLKRSTKSAVWHAIMFERSYRRETTHSFYLHAVPWDIHCLFLFLFQRQRIIESNPCPRTVTFTQEDWGVMREIWHRFRTSSPVWKKCICCAAYAGSSWCVLWCCEVYCTVSASFFKANKTTTVLLSNKNALWGVICCIFTGCVNIKCGLTTKRWHYSVSWGVPILI